MYKSKDNQYHIVGSIHTIRMVKGEERISDLQVQGRVILIHAIHQWKDTVVP